jgi:tetratricopeptide (TPR) repeat protein
MEEQIFLHNDNDFSGDENLNMEDVDFYENYQLPLNEQSEYKTENEKPKKADMIRTASAERIVDCTKRLFETGKYKQCIKICVYCLKYKKFTHISGHLIYTIANCFYALGNFKKAAKFFNLSLRKNVPLSALYYNISTVLEKSKKSDKETFLALYKCLKKRLETNPECIYTRLKFAKMNAEILNYDEAISDYCYVLSKDPTMFYAMYNLSCLYLIKKDYQPLGLIYIDMANYYKNQILPNHIETYDEKDIENPINRSMEYLGKAYPLIPNNIEIPIAYAELYRMLDKHKESLMYIDQALKMNSKDYRIYYIGFLIYDEIGDTFTAREMIKLSIFLNLNFIKGYNALGNMLRKEKAYDASLKVFENALLREPDNVLLLNNYANCFMEMVLLNNLIIIIYFNRARDRKQKRTT